MTNTSPPPGRAAARRPGRPERAYGSGDRRRQRHRPGLRAGPGAGGGRRARGGPERPGGRGGRGARRREARVADLADAGAIDLLPAEVDILVNNAGLQHVAPLTEFPPERFDLIQKVMVTAPFLLMRRTLPHMYARGWGRIVNVSSVHGLRASAYKSAYVAAKHALEGLSKVAAIEGAPHGVTSNCVNPGYVRTPSSRARSGTRPPPTASARGTCWRASCWPGRPSSASWSRRKWPPRSCGCAAPHRRRHRCLAAARRRLDRELTCGYASVPTGCRARAAARPGRAAAAHVSQAAMSGAVQAAQRPAVPEPGEGADACPGPGTCPPAPMAAASLSGRRPGVVAPRGWWWRRRHGGCAHSRAENYGVPPHTPLTCAFLRCGDTRTSPSHVRKWCRCPPPPPPRPHRTASGASSPRVSSAPPSGGTTSSCTARRPPSCSTRCSSPPPTRSWAP